MYLILGANASWRRALKVRLGVRILMMIAVAGCAASPRTAATEVRNDSDRNGVVRLVGANGTIDLAVPPHSLVLVNAPPAIGEVSSAWLGYDDCTFTNGGPIYGDGTNGLESFDYGGLLWFGDNKLFGGTSGWTGSPPPAPAATTTSVCAGVPTPAIH
jgi:hypothetical protein